jgi:heterodisulfide reductase subunit A
MARARTIKKARRTKTAGARKKAKPEPAVLVIGAGVGGMRAALDIAECGYKVYLLDRSPKVGGTASQLDKWFPTDDCSFCKLLPTFYTEGAGEFCLRRTLVHPGIELLTSSELKSVSGEAPNFEVTVVRRPRMVDRSRCIGCDKCVSVCPVSVEDEFNEGLVKRKAVYLSHPNAVPNNYVIDVAACTKCGECVKVCPTEAISLDAKEEKLVLNVGAIVADPGFKSFSAEELQEFGYGRYENVVTNTELERMLSGTGVARLPNPPKRVAFFQCVGSRDEKRPYCSSACCMYAIKEANLIKENFPECDVTIFFMDMRVFGKGYHRYYLDAVKSGVRFVRSRVPAVDGVTESGELTVVYEDESGKLKEEDFDMVVLSVGQTEPQSTVELAEKLGIELNDYGFSAPLPFDQVGTSREGVFVCGSFSSPADIPDTVVRASGAAARAMGLLPAPAAREEVATEERGEEEPAIGVFLCSCGEDIPGRVDLESISRKVEALPGVKHVSRVNFLCLAEGLTALSDSIRNENLNRIVVAACSVHPYQTLFRKSALASGVDPDMVEVVNIREQVSWVHEKKDEATAKAGVLIESVIQDLADRKHFRGSRQEVVKRAVVIGGGISGMTAALDLSDRGFEVELVERSGRLGGRLVEKSASYEGEELPALLEKKTKAVEKSPKVRVRFNSEVDSLTGSAGNFKVDVTTDGKTESIGAGAIIVAVGAEEHTTGDFGYGSSERIISLADFERKLDEPDSPVGKAESFAFVQCVGSRNDERPFCSRVCCSAAIFAALRLKEANPDAQVFVLYRDIMTYGFNEELYRRARNAGIVFIRYDLDEPPRVEVADSRPRVVVKDPLLEEYLSLRPDYLVLSFGMEPGPAKRLAHKLGLELTDDHFLKEVNVKFRPLDLARDGVFMSGTAHSPMSVSEAITSGHAAAARASAILSRNYLDARTGVAVVSKRRCSACELCIEACPFDARYMDYDEMVARVREYVCQGCGTCTAVCPNGASKLRRYEEKDIFSILETLIQ